MANLIAKKLSKLPIGTHVELTYGDGASHHEKVSGIITDSDFTANIEMTLPSGEELVLDYSLIRGVQVTKPLSAVLKELSSGAKVEFSYGSEDNREPNLIGTIVENDKEENLEIKLSSGEETVLNYSIIRSLIVQGSPTQTTVVPDKPKGPDSSNRPKERITHTGKDPLYQQEPDDILNHSDSKIKETYDLMPKEDRQKLSSFYDRFKYGARNNDRNKMEEAANQVRQVLFREDDNNYLWSREAALFCGYLLRRANIYDPAVFIVGNCFEEAAFAAWRKEAYDLAGVYAITALLEDPENIQNLTIILACSIVKCDDISGLRIFSKHLPDGMESLRKVLINEALAAKGFQVSVDQDAATAMEILAKLYPNTEMGEEVKHWLPPEQGGLEKAVPEQNKAAPAKPAAPVYRYGTISRLNWAEQTGVITGEDGNLYTFRYQDIADTSLAKAIEDCLRSDLDGKTYMVKFYANKDAARKIQLDDALVDRARAIAADTTRGDRFEAAFELCKKAVDSSDNRRALGDLMKHAITLYTSKQQDSYVKEALEIYEKNVNFYPNNAFAILDVAQCYNHLKKYPLMMEHADKALSLPVLTVKQKVSVLTNYLHMTKEFYDASEDKTLLAKMLEKIDELKESYSSDFTYDPQAQRLYTMAMVPYRVIAECGLDLLPEAEADYANVSNTNTMRPYLDELMAKTRARLAPKKEAKTDDTKDDTGGGESGKSGESVEDTSSDGFFGDDPYKEPADEDPEEEIVPYKDSDGWDALKLTKQEVIDYALRITGPDRIPAILAYLRAGASLNEAIEPVYHAVALAANDPMEAPDYSITALITALAASDTNYPKLNDCCMGAAFLRASFLSGRGYDYSAQGLRDSIAISQQIPALRNAYNTLEQFRGETGCAIDIYADYRNQGVKKLNADIDSAIRHADELNTKYILTPPREKSSFARILETRKVLFSRDGYLAVMLKHIIERDQEALEAEKENFIATYLNGTDQFSAAHISTSAVDALVADAWDQACRNMQLKKTSATLQGDRRNNLRSNVSEIITLICQWYALSEQSAGLTWRTEQGEAAYQRLRPRLMEQLKSISEDCQAELESNPDPELCTGLFLLSAAAKELSARLDGSWKFDQEKYLYIDFLRSNNIMLTEDFMPELSSTFCVLPAFNVMARIRNHVEGPKKSFQEQLDTIYGVDKTCNNYGTADRIVEYLEAIGEKESVKLREKPEQFVTQTEMQIDMRFRSFRETYALAMNYGQIIKSDAFCYTLEDTVRYWYAFCKETKNYGFFTSILLQAENQIHASAQQYETQLDEQLDALIASNQRYFDEHPDYAEAIRTQIANQNFTVAEDWMARIRIGDFSLEVQQPEALAYLEQFWNSYVVIYNRVADASRSLGALLGRREVRNKDTKHAQQLIDFWLNNGNPSNPERIGVLLNLLGWQNIHVNQYPFAGEPRAEIYEVRKERSAAGLTTPLHPIAAFGSSLEKKQMYVVCLYGIYDCDRLYEKMRAMDVIDGSKVFLLDYALGQADRRALARKLKRRESGLNNVNIVIDRVLITYLANNYNEHLINRILMATSIPFSYCQPYVVESVHMMPPEIFIGRKDELRKIEQADGVNVIYGGRQLGKSALFKKARADIDGRQNQRAVFVDIKDLDCANAAKRLSEELIALNITPDAEITEDWGEICRNIRRRLRGEGEEITYFLLMLDEADRFINDCANYGYSPIGALKDIQQTFPGQFKYVLAGLHNIVKFNHQVALGNNSVITHISSLKITPFRIPEAQELLTVPLSYLGFSLPSKVTVSQILATCNYFPGLIQLYAQKLIESIREADYAGYNIRRTPPYAVSDEHLRRVMADKEFVDQIHEKFEITLTLGQDQGNCYYPLTLLIGWMYNVTPSKSGYTAKDVLYQAKDLAISPLKDLDVERIDELLVELQDLNILRSVSDNSYLLASKNFRDLLGSDEEIFEKLMNFGGVAV